MHSLQTQNSRNRRFSAIQQKAAEHPEIRKKNVPYLIQFRSVVWTSIRKRQQTMNTFLLLLRTTVIMWGFFLRSDSKIRARYEKHQLARGDPELPPVKAASKAWAERAVLKFRMRRATSPVGNLVIRWMRPHSPTLNEILEFLADGTFGRSFNQLNPGEADTIYRMAVPKSGRSNKNMRKFRAPIVMMWSSYFCFGIFGVSVLWTRSRLES
ncbi:hypothetical protein BD410DRAFT_785611 [Rickenella mellea]|uniref:Uncharacterized protein n=1 Tax=Rickenella mellea TaxID=50990 RepID=A0A4Y7QBY1_9AGAM|nr:hypothetical protein BD410DRAFT_785611 [Rickenella mellea]